MSRRISRDKLLELIAPRSTDLLKMELTRLRAAVDSELELLRVENARLKFIVETERMTRREVKAAAVSSGR